MGLPSDVSADLFRAIAEFTYDWESWVDERGATRWINAAVLRITGYSVDECLLLPDYPLPLAHEADRALLEEALRDAARGGSGNDVEFRIVHKLGDARWVAISWQAVRSSQGQPIGYRTSVRDIDQRKRAEEELLATRRRAEALAQARTELLANVSHELRSPAHCIAGFAELLLQDALPGPQRRYVELIADQCQSMLRQVEDLLSLSALEAGGVELARAPVDLVALGESLIAGGAEDARQRGLTLRSELRLTERWLLGDALRIKQILRNLLDNALKFTERGGVTLTLAEEGGLPRWLTLTVSDTGQGMEPDQIATLLLPFRQADASSSRKRGGVGLGLAIVDRLVRAMHGELSLTSKKGEGTTVRVRLPFVPASAPLMESPKVARSELTGNALVVDDSPVARELLCEMLRTSGFSCEQAGSASSALRAIQARHFDVIFLDYQMPDSDGADAARALRGALANTAHPRPVRIYILSANVFANEQLCGARALVDGVLTKPLSRAALHAVLTGGSPVEPREEGVALGTEWALLDDALVRELAETRARDGQTLLQKLLPKVERDIRAVLSDARAQLVLHDLPQLRRLCHSAAGHAALIGAKRARALASALEDRLDGEDLPKAETIEQWLTSYERACEQALAALAPLAALQPSRPGAGS